MSDPRPSADGPSRVALVTGAAGGIGGAVARRLARDGIAVCVGYRSGSAAARRTVVDCEAAGGQAFACKGDVVEDGDCRRLVAKTVECYGRLDIVVNAAGSTRFVAADDLDGLTAADWRNVFAVNVTGAFQVIRAAVPHLRAGGSGAVVNVSSFAARLGYGSSLAYASSKGALDTMTLGLARTLAPRVRVNAVCPSFVDTGWASRGLDSDGWRALKQRIEQAAPGGRIATPEEVAECVAWLAGPAALVTGELLACDGGMHLAHPLAIPPTPQENASQ